MVVVGPDGYEGLLTRRQIAASHRDPDQTAGSLVSHVPRLDEREDVRETARLMVESDTRVLPVFEGEELLGVVTADDVLAGVRENLDVLAVDDIASSDPLTVAPAAPIGEALDAFRRHRISHVPVVEAGRVVGMLGLHDVAAFTARRTRRSQAGDAAGGFAETKDADRGGPGAGQGEQERLLELPVEHLMTTPPLTVAPERSLDEAVGEMLAADASSLVVTADGAPTGIVTKTDTLDALTWGSEGHRPVQVYGVNLLDDVTYDDVVAIIERFEERRDDLSVLDATVHLHDHDEQHRELPQVFARIRLDTDRGFYTATGTGYGARHALRRAAEVLERRLRDGKTYGRSKEHRVDDYWERRFGWWLEG